MDDSLPVLEQVRYFDEALELAKNCGLNYHVLKVLSETYEKFTAETGKLIIKRGSFY